jgi:hypothetical protein
MVSLIDEENEKGNIHLSNVLGCCGWPPMDGGGGMAMLVEVEVRREGKVVISRLDFHTKLNVTRPVNTPVGNWHKNVEIECFSQSERCTTKIQIFKPIKTTEKERRIM